MAKRVESKPSYLGEMLLHPWNGYAAALSVTAGALLSIPFGLGVGLLPLIAFGAGEAIAALFVPSHPDFREWADRKARAVARERIRAHLVDEIASRVKEGAEPTWALYQRMRERIASLGEMASKHETQLSPRDVEALEDASVKFLGYWLSKLTMADRRDLIDERSLSSRLAHVDGQLDGEKSRSERARLEKTRADLIALLERKTTLGTRLTEVETAMLTMADALEEVFQQVVAHPTSPEVGTQLREAAERLRREEALDHAIDDELGEALQAPEERARRIAARRGVASAGRSP